MCVLNEGYTFLVPKHFAESWPTILQNVGYKVSAEGSYHCGRVANQLYEGDIYFSGFTVEACSLPPLGDEFAFLRWRRMRPSDRSPGVYPKEYLKRHLVRHGVVFLRRLSEIILQHFIHHLGQCDDHRHRGEWGG